MDRTFYVYMLRCADGSYYIGHTEHLERRVTSHEAGEISGYTATRRPIVLVWSETFSSRIEALEAERRIKGWSRAKKEALIAGDWQRISDSAKSSRSVRPEPVEGRAGGLGGARSAATGSLSGSPTTSVRPEPLGEPPAGRSRAKSSP